MKQVFTQILILVSLSMSCQSNINIDDEVKFTYLQKGRKIVSESYGEISAQLHRYLVDGKIENAIGACSMNAMPIIDSLSLKHNALIRRTSLKARNPLNRPKSYELRMLKDYERKSKENCKPEVKLLKDNKVAFFSPIFVNATCLKCHGKEGSTLDSEVSQLIKKRYPHDKAVNYEDGDLRGMWSITFIQDLQE